MVLEFGSVEKWEVSGISREESCQTYITSVLVSLRVGRSEEGLSRF